MLSQARQIPSCVLQDVNDLELETEQEKDTQYSLRLELLSIDSFLFLYISQSPAFGYYCQFSSSLIWL